MGDIKQSLTRKLGPLPVWAWALIAGIALYIYRQRHAGSSGAANVAKIQADTQAQAASQVPQSPLALSPGESVYDPNTGNLMGGADANNQFDSILGLIAALLTQKPPGHKRHNTRKHHPHDGHHPPHKHPKKHKHHSGSRAHAHKSPSHPKYGAGTHTHRAGPIRTSTPSNHRSMRRR